MKSLLITSILAFVINSSSAQGFNNDFSYDETDIKFLFKTIGIEVFKYPFLSSKKQSLNIVIEEYKKGKMVKQIDFFENFKPMLELLDEPPSYFFTPLNDSTNSWLRFYLTSSDSALVATIKTEKIEKQYKFNTSNLGLYQTRSFDNIPIYIQKNQPLFTYYGNEKSEMISCPGDAQPKDISKLYDYVLVFYAIPIVLE